MTSSLWPIAVVDGQVLSFMLFLRKEEACRPGKGMRMPLPGWCARRQARWVVIGRPLSSGDVPERVSSVHRKSGSLQSATAQIHWLYEALA